MRWYDRLELLGYDQHVIVCVQPQAFQTFQTKFSSYRVEYRPLPKPDDALDSLPLTDPNHGARMRERVEMLFALRWRYLYEHLKRGIPVLITDVDNFWNRYYPLAQLENSHYDVFHALETKHPVEIFEKQGFVVNGGFAWLKPTPRTFQYMENILHRCGVRCDDQVIINEVLANEMNMTWSMSILSRTTQMEENQQTHDNRVSEEFYERLLGLVQEGFDGYSNNVISSNNNGTNLSKLRIKIWSRAFCYRGRNDPQPCPHDNWVSMPFIAMTRRHQGPRRKLQAFDIWDNTCPNEYSQKSDSLKKNAALLRQT